MEADDLIEESKLLTDQLNEELRKQGIALDKSLGSIPEKVRDTLHSLHLAKGLLTYLKQANQPDMLNYICSFLMRNIDQINRSRGGNLGLGRIESISKISHLIFGYCYSGRVYEDRNYSGPLYLDNTDYIPPVAIPEAVVSLVGANYPKSIVLLISQYVTSHAYTLPSS